jgi:hypothetical protein
MSDSKIYSYPTVFAIGHSAITGIFDDPVIVEEKIDGSQLSFQVAACDDGTLELLCRSKGKQLVLDAPEKMFSRAVKTICEEIAPMHANWIYRCEYLEKPKHNVLAYDRVPNKHLIGFDICTGLETYLPYAEKKAEFERIGLECVPLLYEGMVDGVDQFYDFLELTSILGGSKIEGVVVKNYKLFTAEKKVAIGKYVSEKFKEVAGGEWRKSNPTETDITNLLISSYRTPARWQKAIQHLKERGELEWSPRDIGSLIREIQADTKKECEEEIKDALFKHFWPKIQRGITAGAPEWFKELLLASAFEKGDKSD